MLQFWRALYVQRGFNVDAVERAAVDRESSFSIHS
jgi:hypothetical protein